MDACGLPIPAELWGRILHHVPWPRRVHLRDLSRAWRDALDASAWWWRDAPLREGFAE